MKTYGKVDTKLIGKRAGKGVRVSTRSTVRLRVVFRGIRSHQRLGPRMNARKAGALAQVRGALSRLIPSGVAVADQAVISLSLALLGG